MIKEPVYIGGRLCYRLESPKMSKFESFRFHVRFWVERQAAKLSPLRWYFKRQYKDGHAGWTRRIEDMKAGKSTGWWRVCTKCAPHAVFEADGKYGPAGDTYFSLWQSLRDMFKMPCDRCGRRFFYGIEMMGGFGGEDILPPKKDIKSDDYFTGEEGLAIFRKQLYVETLVADEEGPK